MHGKSTLLFRVFFLAPWVVLTAPSLRLPPGLLHLVAPLCLGVPAVPTSALGQTPPFVHVSFPLVDPPEVPVGHAVTPPELLPLVSASVDSPVGARLFRFRRQWSISRQYSVVSKGASWSWI